MPNSTAIANVEIQLQDGLQSSIPPVLFRTVPPVSLPSNIQVAYNGYTKLNPGGSEPIIVSGTKNTVYPFVYLRNAGTRGLIVATILFTDVTSETAVFDLSPGGVFLFANTGPNLGTTNAVKSLSIAPGDSNPIIAEWLIAA